MTESILGIPLGITLMWGAGVFYAIGAIVFFASFRREFANELMIALFAFLVSMTLALLLMGVGEYWKNMWYGYLGTLAILVGSAFMLKFPFTIFSVRVRQMLFRLFLVTVMFLFIWMVLFDSGRTLMAQFVMWYMIFVNGLVVGFFVFFVGLRSKERWLKIKATGGGVGIMSCCIASHVASIAGAVLLSAIFQFIAPVILVASVLLGKRIQRRSLRT